MPVHYAQVLVQAILGNTLLQGVNIALILVGPCKRSAAAHKNKKALRQGGQTAREARA